MKTAALGLAWMVFAVATLTGCGDRTGNAPATTAVTASNHAGVRTAQPPLVTLPKRRGFASLPDRGELLRYRVDTVRHDGAYTWRRTDLSETHALDAISSGRLHLLTPAGEALDVQFDRYIEHPSGDWTWIGHIPGHPGEQTILTFGEHAAFGSIGQPDQAPLRLTVRNGSSWLVETDPTKVAGINNAATRPTRTDYRIPPRTSGDNTLAGGAPTQASAPTSTSVTATATTTVDLVLGYTQGFASDNGGTSGAVTRLNYLVDVANAAYTNSQISLKVRLVGTVAVSYADNTSNDSALDQLTGYDSSSNSRTTPNAAFNALRAAREQYGADLVSMVRSFRDPENGGCGLGWLLGGGRSGIDSSDAYYAYSVVADGSDAGTDGHTYYCLDETLAHEMGHNMGAQHDVETAKGTDGTLDASDYGAYAYSFGYKNTTYAFFTVMAYGDSGQHIYRIFSDPRSTFCGGRACGTSQADNAQTLSRTSPVVATFRATVVAGPVVGPARNDVNGDGKTDLLWSNRSTGDFAHWLMNGATIAGSKGFAISSRFTAIGSGDLDGNGHADIIWTTSAGDVYAWLGSGTGYTSRAIHNVGTGWTLIGTGDVNGDGKSDLLWSNPSRGLFVHWLMNGNLIVAASSFPIGSGFAGIGTGDLDGNGVADVLWEDGHGNVYVWLGSSRAYTSRFVYRLTPGWVLVGTGDVNADGKSDLLWSNRAAGSFVHWAMNGASIAGSATFAVSTTWEPVGYGDLDGNGHADVVWKNGSGDTYVWLGSGTSYASRFIYRVPSGWSAVQ